MRFVTTVLFCFQLLVLCTQNAECGRLFAVSGGANVHEINTSTGEVTDFASLPLGFWRVTFDGDDLWAIDFEHTPELIRYDPMLQSIVDSFDVNTIESGAMAYLDGLLYFHTGGFFFQQIIVFDPDNRAVVETQYLDDINSSFFVDMDGITEPNALLISTYGSNELIEVDPATWTVSNRFDLPFTSIAAVDGAIYTLGENGDEITVLNRAGDIQNTFPISRSVGSLFGYTAVPEPSSPVLFLIATSLVVTQLRRYKLP